MHQQLKGAINAYIIDEFKLEPKTLDPDFDFQEDLNLTPIQLDQFLQNLQEALSITLPEEKISQIQTLGDLYSAFDTNDDSLD